MKTSISSFALALVPVLGISLAAVPGTHAAVEKTSNAHSCGAFPNVAWWVNDPAKVVGMVNKRYKGDWDKYIAGWNRYGGSLQQSLENGEARVIKSQKKTLKGLSLAVHVAMVKKRIVVLECLRDAENGNKNLDQLETAAGGGGKTQPQSQTGGRQLDWYR